MTGLESITLTGRLVRLEPLATSHLDGAIQAVNDGKMWDRWYTSVVPPEQMPEMIAQRLRARQEGTMLPFATIRTADEAFLGMTSYYDIDAEVPRLSIGYTWNRQSAHGTGTNPESKLLLMRHAFDTLGVEVVRYETHFMNHQSRAAIERLGARLDGILRADQRDRQGRLRDTVVYSISKSEWPMVEANLEHRLRTRD